MRPNAVLINVGRGALLDEDALVEFVGAGRIGGAILDVFQHEPLPADSPLWSTPNIIVTPHISGPSTVDGVSRFLSCQRAALSGRRAFAGDCRSSARILEVNFAAVARNIVGAWPEAGVV